MSDKPRLVAVNPDEAVELTKDRADLSVPYTFKANGWCLLAEADQLNSWRALRSANTSGVTNGS